MAYQACAICEICRELVIYPVTLEKKEYLKGKGAMVTKCSQGHDVKTPVDKVGFIKIK